MYGTFTISVRVVNAANDSLPGLPWRLETVRPPQARFEEQEELI